jgi:hypothetical protein
VRRFTLFALKLSAINLSSGVKAILEGWVPYCSNFLGLALILMQSSRLAFSNAAFLFASAMASESNDQFVCQLF